MVRSIYILAVVAVVAALIMAQVETAVNGMQAVGVQVLIMLPLLGMARRQKAVLAAIA